MTREPNDWRKVDIILQRSVTNTYGDRDSYLETPEKIQIYTEPYPEKEGQKFVFNLHTLLENNKEEIDERIIKAFQDETSTLYLRKEYKGRKVAEKMLLETIEGQHLLEYIIANFTNWEAPLDLPHLTAQIEEETAWYDDYRYLETIHNDSLFDEELKTQFEQEAENFTPFQDLTDLPCHTHCSYVLTLLDEKWRTWKYVGESSNILSRLGTHYKKEGDFSKPDDIQLKIQSVDTIRSDISERNLYKQVCENNDIPNKRILGGQ